MILYWMLVVGAFAAASEKPAVVVTTYPLYEVMHQVGGDTIDLEKIIPFGTDIHTFRPSPKTMVTVSRAALFVYSGAGLEPWSEQLLTNLSSQTAVVDMSRHVKLLSHEAGDHDAEEEHHTHDAHDAHDHAGHHHGPVDPHYWLDADNMIAMTREAVEALAMLRPDQRTVYEQRAGLFIDQLKTLDALFRARLKTCDQHDLVSNHDAFGYLAHRYGFETHTVTGLSPDQQPSAKAMAQTIALVREHRIKTIFFESFVSDNVARALARETGAAVMSLQPLANLGADEAASNANYITIMEENLEKIANALECH
jgi:zinc transport system substrate-binding protein